MLQDVSDSIRDCYERAERCRRKADELSNPDARESFLHMERRWLDLARSFEFSERLSRYCDGFRNK